MLVPIYTGIFLDNDDIYSHFPSKLSVQVGHPHVTLVYRGGVESAHEEFLGEMVKVRVVGYGNDGKNEGLFVALDNTIPYMGADRPHITLSIAEGAKAVNTAFVSMTEKRIGTLKGRVGYFMVDGTIMFNKEEQK